MAGKNPPRLEMICAANTFSFSHKVCTGVLFYSQQDVLLKAAAARLADRNAARRSPYNLTAADSSVELLFITTVGEPAVLPAHPTSQCIWTHGSRSGRCAAHPALTMVAPSRAAILWCPVKQQRHAQPIHTGHAGDTPASSSSRQSARSTPGQSVQVRALRPRGGRLFQRIGWVG
eukprot:4861043-Pleurochrysis_carterae.AAC.1